MMRNRTFVALAATGLVAIGLIGCMKRKETITIASDGGVRIELAYEADSKDELYGGDASPSTESGWKTELTIDTDKDGKETYKLSAEAAFAPDSDLPDNFAAQFDPQADLHLRFPTSVTREERADGTYYHFRRSYPRRPWAQVETLRKMLLDEKVKDISDKDAAELTHEDRVKLVKILAEAAMVNMAAFARAAFLEVTPAAAQDGWLRAEATLKTLREGQDYERLAKLMEHPDKEQTDLALAAEAAALERAALDGIISALKGAGYTERQTTAFLDRYHWHKRYYDVTGDLGDDAFEIEVEMPGEIVAADMMGGTCGNKVGWQFDGQLFRDRDLELMATSRVAKK